jgi:predicted small lipoprotein YifL
VAPDPRPALSRLALTIAVWALALGGLDGCGQRGPLYLPERQAVRTAGEPAPAGQAQEPDEDDDGQDSADRDGGAE